jgi:cysteinyl-tRNA synthetase
MTGLPEHMQCPADQLAQVQAAVEKATDTYTSLIVAQALDEDEQVVKDWANRLYAQLRDDLDQTTVLYAIVALLREEATRRAVRVINGMRAGA